MRKSVEPSTTIAVDLPASLARDLHTLLYDPRTRKTRYRALSQLATQLFGNWVDAQRDSAAVRPQPNPQLEDL